MRHVKQLIYGVFYLAVWSGVIAGLYFWMRPEPSCFDNARNQDETGVDCGGICARVCIPDTLLPPEAVHDPVLIPIVTSSSTQRVSLLAEVRNRNLGFGASYFPYTFQVMSRSGDIIASFEGTSFIYPGEIKYLSIPNAVLPPAPTAASAKMYFGEARWAPEDRFSRPLLVVQTVSGVIANDNLIAKGTLANQDSVPFPEVRLIALFRNAAGVVLGVSETKLQQLDAGTSREFSLFHPLVPDVALERTQVFATAFNPR